MVQCYDCGKPCGKRHPIGWTSNNEFLCDSCARKRQSNAVKVFGGLMFLFFAVVLSCIVAVTVLKPIAASSGYAAAKGLSIGLGIGGVVLFFVLRYIAGKTDGCLTRMLVKTIGFIAYALGVGLLFVTFLLEGHLKALVGVEDAKIDVSTADGETRMTETE